MKAMRTAEEWTDDICGKLPSDPHEMQHAQRRTDVAGFRRVQADALRQAARECENQPTRFAVRAALLAQAKALEETR